MIRPPLYFDEMPIENNGCADKRSQTKHEYNRLGIEMKTRT